MPDSPTACLGLRPYICPDLNLSCPCDSRPCQSLHPSNPSDWLEGCLPPQLQRLQSEVSAQAMVVESLAGERDACRAAVQGASQQTQVRAPGGAASRGRCQQERCRIDALPSPAASPWPAA
jgi:hypothetical protein